MTDNLNNLIKLRNLLAHAWSAKLAITIIPGEVSDLVVIVENEDCTVIEHPRMALPDGESLIAALVEGLGKALEELERV